MSHQPFDLILAAMLFGTAELMAAQDEAGLRDSEEQLWNWHLQNTDIVQGYPGFPAKYSGPNSLAGGGQVRQTVSLDLFLGVRLWPGAEAHADGLVWQGFGLSKTLGVEGFPNGEAFRLGNSVPNVNLARLFVRQTIGFGGEQETIKDDKLQLARSEDISRLTLTAGKISAKDIFDNNSYANDPRTQFMNWSLMANEAWDYPADSIGYTTGVAAELNRPDWAARYGFFQMPRVSNGTAQDAHYLQAWGMITEFERRFALREHSGCARLMAYLNHAHMGSYGAALESSVRPADLTATRAYRYKYGVGLNVEQELVNNIGIFSRLGWRDGGSEAWTASALRANRGAGQTIRSEWPAPSTWRQAFINGSLRREEQAFSLGMAA